MLAGGIAAFLATDLPFPAAGNAALDTGADCLAACRNTYYERYVGEKGYCDRLYGIFDLFCELRALSEFNEAASVTCPEQCKPKAPPPPPPPTTTAPAPSTVSCDPGYTPCSPPGADGTSFCLPPTAICCSVGTAEYCSAGTVCCPGSNRCALSYALCP